MRFSGSPVLAACLLFTVGFADAGLTSTAVLHRGGGKIIFEIYDEPARLQECTGRNDMAAIARAEKDGKEMPYGAGCWSAGMDGFVIFKIKSFDDGIVRTSRVHNSEFKSVGDSQPPAATNSPTGFTPWEFSKVKTNRGTPVCALSAADNVKRSARNIAIKAMANRDHLTITLYDTRWKYKPESKHKATIDFDDKKPLQIEAYGDGPILDAELPVAATAIFLGLMADKQTLRVSAPGAGLVSVGLAGISGPLQQFVDCTRAIK